MRYPHFCSILVILLSTASASALIYGSADPTSFVEDHFDGYAPKGESRYHEILVPENAAELFIEVLSVSGEDLSFELDDPQGEIVEEEDSDYITLRALRPASGSWILKVTGQGDTSNRYVGLAMTTSGESSGMITGAVGDGEIDVSEIGVGENVGALLFDFKTLSDDDLKITLTNPLGRVVWGATSHRPDEVRSETVDYPMPGTWIVEVLGSSVKESGRFGIDWTELSGHEKRPVGQEPISLGSGGDFSGQVTDGEICSYRLEILQGAGFLALGLATLTDDDLKVTLYNPLGEEVWSATSHSAIQPVSTGISFPMPGDWTIEVLGSGVKSSGRYTGWIEILDGPLPISGGLGVTDDLLIGYVSGDEVGRDYALSVPEYTSRLAIDFRSLSDDYLKVVLYSPEMKQVWSSTSSAPDQIRSKTITNPMAGIWTLGFLGPGLKESGLCMAAVTLEPESLPRTPSSLIFEGAIARGDVVDHSILVPENVDMLYIYATRQGGDLELRLQNPSGIEVGQTSSGVLTVAVPLPGSWTLKAVGTDGESAGDYQIRVWMPSPDQKS